MVDAVTRASSEARVAQTAAFGTATENVIKALGNIYKDIEVRCVLFCVYIMNCI